MEGHTLKKHDPRLIDGVLSKWCSWHQRYEPVEGFRPSSRRRGGFHNDCQVGACERTRARDSGHEPYVYFVQAGIYLKIGKSTVHPDKMLGTYNSKNPLECVLLHTEPYATEREALDAEAVWHDIFKHRHHEGEWFHLAPENVV